MGRVFRLALTWLLILVTTAAFDAAVADDATHLRLRASLDRPHDGYCVDVHGTPGYLRTDLPLFAHNCKPALTSDSAVKFEPDGSIRFIALELCITVAGVNSKALPGAAILLRRCGESSAFMETAALQQFSLRADGSLELHESGLCLVVGPRSATTYSEADRWRPLYIDDCQTTEPVRSRWQFAAPDQQ